MPNVIFDLGGVLVRWDPAKIVSDFSNDPDLQQVLLQNVIKHPDWLLLDKGSLSLYEAIDRTSVRTGLELSRIEDFMRFVPRCLTPIPESVSLLKLTYSKGNPVFCLSNMHHAFIDYLESRYDFFNLFAWRVISCRIGSIKPEIEIFKHLIQYPLVPHHSVFIDDSSINIQMAQTLGFKTIHFISPDQCKNELSKLGCI